MPSHIIRSGMGLMVEEKGIDSPILILIVVFVAAGAIGGLYLGVRNVGERHETSLRVIFQDNFNTLDQNIWFANFGNQGAQFWDPSWGTALASDGVLYIRPSYSGGEATIQTRDRVITTFPAVVTFRIRFAGDYYRYPVIILNSVFAEVMWNTPHITWFLGTTNHISLPYGQFLRAYGPNNSISESNKVFEVVPVNEWLEGEIKIYNDRIETRFNGVNLVLSSDLKSIVNSAGGLNLFFGANDDWNQKGLDIDWVKVESVAS